MTEQIANRCHCPGCKEPIEESWVNGEYGEALARVCAGCAGRFPCIHEHLEYECHNCGQLDPGIAPGGWSSPTGIGPVGVSP
jgi:hypothetical protein